MPEEKYWKYFSGFINQKKASPSQDMFLPSLQEFGEWLWDQMPKELQKPIVSKDVQGITYKVKGKLHREDGPAVIYPNGTKRWHINGKLHRTDGPAVEYATGEEEYWINGERVTKEDLALFSTPVT